ncbi:MAG: DHH family phosphoesterase [Oscillospiraceae bacterium]|nr:DHH family phosphoesterase [Oscillospiraceae bacterium]
MNKKLEKAFWPGLWVYFAAMVLFVIGAVIFGNYTLAAAEAGIAAALGAFYIVCRIRRHKLLQNVVKDAFNLPENAGGADTPFPMVLVRLGDESILWANEQFCSITGYQDRYLEQRLTSFVPNVTLDWLVSGKSEYSYDVTLSGRRYRIYGSALRADDPDSTMMGMLYFSDLTELYQVRDEYVRSRPVVSIILVDNYEELTKNLPEGAISSLNARINDVISKWTEDFHGLLRKLERNRFLFVFEKRDLKRAMDEKFSLLEEIHEVENPTGLAASISIGIGVDGVNFEESYDFAALSIEMSLSRGGDQAVIKDRYNFSFYGGRAMEADRRSKVKSRVTSNSMMELIGQSSQVFIMGHSNADLDAIGAAMGISCMCRKKGKKAYIVLDTQNNAAQNLIEEIQQIPEYSQVFISGQDALLQCDNHSVLIVVDTNRPDQVECRPLLETISRVCVVDHHRRAADYIDPVVLNLHEPYASSASELVTELLQYAVEKKDVLPIESKSLLAGIFLDTKSFNVRTGERTFEAAAVLRQWGADTVEVKKLLQSDFQDTMAKYQIIKAARLYRQELAVAALNTTTSRALAAQAADELLNISGITASFVLYPDAEDVYISARSIGDANVQMILEPLGGGGNTATAGARVRNTTVKDALDALIESINQFYET